MDTSINGPYDPKKKRSERSQGSEGKKKKVDYQRKSLHNRNWALY